MSKLDFNVSPYFDDFEPSKNYVKILYRPGRPVQARELNQVQSILQHQISSFANHIFKNGSKVSNARTSLQSKEYVRLLGTPNVAQYTGNIVVTGETSGIRAVLVRGVNAEGEDPATLYVVYVGVAIDGQTATFIPGENLVLSDENDVDLAVVTVRCPSCPGSGLSDTIPPTGRGQFFTVDEGIIYFEGMFIEVAKQDIIITKYMVEDAGVITNFEPCKIGLDFVQTIVTSNDDPTLLDPSLGYPNSTAPGADRYKVDLVLVKRAYEAEDGENFITLAKAGEGGTLEFVKADSEYSVIMDTLAKRTYETNGDYTIRPFRVSFLNAKKVSSQDALGWSLNGSADKLVAVVSPSVAYVKGYRVETIATTPVTFPKARSTKKLSSFIRHFEDRTYILGRAMGEGLFPNLNAATTMITEQTVFLYDGLATASSVAGTVIGTMKISDVNYVSGNIADDTAIYRYFIYDLTMAAGKKLSDAQSFVLPSASFYVNTIPDSISNEVEIYNANNTGLIFKLDRDNVKSLRSIDDPLSGSMSVVVRRKLSGVADGAGVVNFTTSTNEYFDNSAAGFIGWYVLGGNTTKFNAVSTSSMTPTNLSINLGIGAAGASVYVLVDVLRTNQTEKQKTPQNLTYLTNTQPTITIGDEIFLGKADAYRLKSVKVFVDGSPETEVADITDEYELVPNIDEFAYRESKIRRTSAASMAFSSNHRLAINFDYYQHSGNQGYFTIDSYAPALNAVDSGVTYETLGAFVSKTNVTFPIASSIDFRPVIIGNDPIPAVLPANSSTAIFDIEYYLGRADILQINKDGVLSVKLGEPSETPRLPRADDNALKLYEIWLKPYTYSLKDMSTKYIDNRRYTMRDIGAIEKRLTNVEYITVMNVLEKSAADMSIKDDQGLDRFKNGFIADNFSDFQAADLTNREYKAATDRGTFTLRPSFKASNRKLKLNEALSTGIQMLGNTVMKPFTEATLIEQPFATKHLSINPYLQYTSRGTMLLSPNNDVWTDETHLPQVVIDVDAGAEAMIDMADAGGILGTDWGSWIDQNRTIMSTSTTTDRNANTRSTTTTTTQISSGTRTGTVTTVDSRTDSYSIDDIVKDVQLIPYVREAIVEFHATKLKANTIVYAFFDGEPVSEHCRDIGFQLSAENADTATQLVEYGSPLITDENGEIRGEFKIPGGRFFVGEKTFVLSNDPDLTGDSDIEFTRAEANYFAGGLDVTKQDVTMNVISPVFETSQIQETRNSTEVVSRETTVEDLPPPPAVPTCAERMAAYEASGRNSSFFPGLGCLCSVDPSNWICSDPIAQAFTIESDTFITSLDLFFRQVDIVSDSVFVEIRNMINGYPGQTRIARKVYTPDEIQPFCSEDSATAFNVKFDIPVYLEGNTSYCFVIGGYSPNTRAWVARLGGEVVNIPGKIVDTPAVGEVSFRSLNGGTWNAEQFEQIKFKLNCALFDTAPMTLVFENDNAAETYPLDDNPFQTEVGKTRVRVYQKNHGLTVNDRVSISLFETSPFLVQMADFVPQIGQKMHTTSGSGTITNIKSHTVANQYYVTLGNVSGIFSAGQTYVCDALTKTVRDTFLIDVLGSKKPSSYTLNQCTGSVIENSYTTKFPGGTIGGIPVSEFNTEHVTGSLGHSVVEVDSIDSYIINVQTPATLEGRWGGKGIVSYNANGKYEMFNVSGAYLPYRSPENWSLTGVAHGTADSLFAGANYQQMAPINFMTQQDTFLNQPYKVASSVNEQIMLGGGNKSITVTASFNATNPAVSPVINADTFSITTVSNRVEWLDRDLVESTPEVEGNWLPETTSYGGNEIYKYVTRSVNLQTPASDMHIYFDAYKDINADFDVYVKRLSQHDAGTIDSAPWMKVNGLVKNRSSVDMGDLIEYHIIASEHITPYTEDSIDYPGWLDALNEVDPYVTFRVKLVGKTRNSAKPPLFKNLRIIAVT